MDQLTKSWAQRSLASGPRHVIGSVNLLLVYNRGAAFSLGSGATPVIELLAIAIISLVLWQSGRLAKGGASWSMIIGFGLLSGGALSNLADRFFRHHRGGVVDFIQLARWWPVFNLADVAITLGALTVAINLLFLSSPGSSSEVPQHSSRDGSGRVRAEPRQPAEDRSAEVASTKSSSHGHGRA